MYIVCICIYTYNVHKCISLFLAFLFIRFHSSPYSLLSHLQNQPFVCLFVCLFVFSGDVASKRNGKLCSVDKANVLDVSQLWRDVVIEVMEKDFPDVELSHMYVDNAAMQLIRWPKQFDTIVCGNIFGDILSDEASMLVGSLGMLPSASIGESGPGVFEPCHGSAPDIAGENKANPLAMILSAAMMLKYDLDRPDEAQLLEDAVEAVLDQGLRTADIKQEGDGCELIGCVEMGKAVAAQVESLEMKSAVSV